MAQFALDVARWVEQTKTRADQVCRAVALEMHKRIVLRSPVGNPELWAANAEAALQRSQHNAVVDQINANLMSDPHNVTAKGNLKRSVRSPANRRLSKAQLAKAYPFKTGAGYVGGRFRANWFTSIGGMSTVTTENVDPSGGQSIAEAAAALTSFTAGPPIFITNSLPYSIRLENGWSKQAPEGMVKVTAIEFRQVVNQVAAALKQ